MKTKIIYISGSEFFDMHDIRNAFDQVRSALQLGPDTVLFGVPVDKANALSTDTETISSVSVSMAEITSIPPQVSEPDIIDDTPTVSIDADSHDAQSAIVAPEQDVVAQKKPRKRTKSVAEPDSECINEPVPETNNTEKVVSILSVLTAKQETPTVSDVDDETVDMSQPEPEIDVVADTPVADTPIDVTEITETIETIDEITIINDTDDEIIENDTAQAVSIEDSIEDMITDEAPVVPQEKTLEQLLESMTPLREDLEHEQHIDETDSVDEYTTDDIHDVLDTSADDDATLEQLANEFAENQDKITPAPKTENHGKIGKLKNILPFKKARRDDSGLMGDLFGWAGIAANDEEFSIPGFFTNAASKK